MIEFSDQDKQVLDLAQQLIWRKGVNNPMESQIANALTALAQRVIGPQKPPAAPAKEAMLKNKEGGK